MPKVQANEQSLAQLRHHLKPLLTDVRAAHIAEALARALGFRNNAALIAALRREEDGSPELTMDVEAFAARLAELGYGIRADVASRALETAAAMASENSGVVWVDTFGNQVSRRTSAAIERHYSRRGDGLWVDVPAEASMTERVVALISAMAEQNVWFLELFCLPENESKGRQSSSSTMFVRDKGGMRQIGFPGMFESGRNEEELQAIRKEFYLLAGGDPAEYDRDEYFAFRASDLVVAGERLALPSGDRKNRQMLVSIRYQFEPKRNGHVGLRLATGWRDWD